MTKSELIETVAARFPSIPKRDVETVLETMFKSMTDALVNDQRIEIRGFGSFSIRVREAREGRNPKTGEKVQVPSKRTPFWTAGRELRERVNAGMNNPDPSRQA